MRKFRRRRDQGEQIQLDGEKIVSLNTSYLKSISQKTGEYNSRTDSASQLLSPLRVALPPLSSQLHMSISFSCAIPST